MATAQKDPVLVVLQLNGGNDYMNTVVPFSNPHYYDNRPKLQIDEGDVLKLNDEVGLHPTMGPLRDIYKKGDMALLNGIG